MNDLENNPFVSRGGLKLASANFKFKLEFKDKLILDVGSSTGGFSDFALQHGARQVIAIEAGSNQMNSRLKLDPRIELHEKTDILDVGAYKSKESLALSFIPDIVLIDLSFVSLRNILPHIRTLIDNQSQVVAMVKPQFEAESQDKHKGIIKNEAIRRRIMKEFEHWVRKYFLIINKADSEVTGSKGNKERFYLLNKT